MKRDERMISGAIVTAYEECMKGHDEESLVGQIDCASSFGSS